MPALPRSGQRVVGEPILSSRLSTSVSTRETKNDATERIVARSMAARLACSSPVDVGVDDLAVALDAEKISVTLMLMPSAMARGDGRASRPSVAGILISTLGRSTSHDSCNRLGDGLVGVVGHARVYLDRDPSVRRRRWRRRPTA